MAKRRKNEDNPQHRKIWTVVCLVVICVIAAVLRINLIYKLYPLEYQEEIALYSETYDLDEYLVCAVICTESHFDASAVSYKGASGLMQIMPDTGEWAAGIIGIEGFSEEMLFEPETNIMIGCWYLSYLADMFDGDQEKILAAYNAGPANVKGWIDSEDGSLTILYEETAEYVERVQRYYEIYKGLYDDF